MALVATETNKGRRFPEFKTKDRVKVIVDMMANGRTSRDEWTRQPDFFKGMGLETVDDLHSCIGLRSADLWNMLVKFEQKMRPARDRINQLIDNGHEFSNDEQQAVNQVMDSVNRAEQYLTDNGFILDDSVSYQKVKKGSAGSSASVINSFDDLMSGDLADILNPEE